MDALDFIETYKDVDIEQLKDIVIQGYWTVGNVERTMFDQDIPLDEFTRDEKRRILSDVMREWGDGTTQEINDAIWNAVEELHDKKKNEE